MLAPLSWIFDFVKTKTSPRELAWKLTEAGLNVEQVINQDGEKIFDIEVTPNRPDWLSILGVAREVAAIADVKVKLPDLREIPKPTASLPLTIKNDFSLCPRYTAITVSGVSIKPSPKWLQARLKLVGLRPINNLVDISNYVTFELGVPIHVFDYDKFKTKTLVVKPARGGEEFVSVDGLPYKLPQDAIIISDNGRVIDLCGIKGGNNTGISADTKNIFVHVPIYTPALIRRTSKTLNLVSPASYIYERGANAGGTLETLQRVVALILEFAGGKIASEVIDLKRQEFGQRQLSLSHTRLETILKTNFGSNEVVGLLGRLGLKTTTAGDPPQYSVTIPTYRQDLQIEEDLIEEVARLFGYNKFAKTIPAGEIPTADIAFRKDFGPQEEVKNLLTGAGFSEIKTFSLASSETPLKVTNPVSRDYQFLKSSLISGLFEGLKLNLPNQEDVSLFELEKVYGGTIDKPKETYSLAAASSAFAFAQMKGVLETLANYFGVVLSFERTRPGEPWHPAKTAEIIVKKNNKTLGYLGEIHPRLAAQLEINQPVLAFEINFDLLESVSAPEKIYQPIPKYPAQVEDLALVLPPRTLVGELISAIKKVDKQIVAVVLIDTHEDSRTFRLYYLNPEKTLTDIEVAKIRGKVLAKVKKEFGAGLKE